MSPEPEPQLKERQPYFAVVGGVGVGKSELTDLLASSFGFSSFREEYVPNPHLPLFYTQDPRQHAFNSQMFFLTEEARQMRPLISRLPTESIVHDQYIEGDAFFEAILRYKMNFISPDEHSTYRSCYRALTRGNFLPEADVYIGVTASEETVTQRIRERGREMEIVMQERYPDYFPTIVRSFKDWFKRLARRRPLILIDTDKHDFVNSDMARDFVLGEVRAWSCYHLSSPNQLNLKGKDGAQIILPPSLRPPFNIYRDLTPGLTSEQRMLSNR